jgi:hypothetical protein
MGTPYPAPDLLSCQYVAINVTTGRMTAKAAHGLKVVFQILFGSRPFGRFRFSRICDFD